MKKKNKGFIATSILFGIVALLFITFAIILGNSHASLKNDKMYGNMLKEEITNFLGVILYPNGGYVEKTKLEIDFNGTYGERDENGNIKELPTPVREGYKFEGWYTAKEGGDPVVASTSYQTYKANRLYAHWERMSYNLKVNPNGGTYNGITDETKYHLSFEEEMTIETPTRYGYTFEGWTLVESEEEGKGSKISGNIFQMGYMDATLKANWKEKKIIVTINPNLGTWKNSSEIQTIDSEYGRKEEIPKPVRDGYTFTGWEFGKNEGETESKTTSTLDGKTLTVGGEDVILIATWQVNNYEYIVNHLLEGTNKEFTFVEADTYEGEFNTIVRPPYKTYTGYKVIGGQTELLITSDTKKNIVEYKYAILAIVLKIDANGGVYPGPAGYDAFFNEGIELLIPTKEGYTFTNWTPEAGTVVDNIYRLGNDVDNVDFTDLAIVNIKANWKANDYILTLDANGGTVVDSIHTVTYDGTYDSYNDPVRTGYTFKGWSLTEDGKNMIDSNTVVKTAADHKLYAIWEANTYEVTLYPRGGSVNPTTITVTFGDTYKELPTPTKNKHNFYGWFTDETAGVQIKNEDTVLIIEDTNLYARWIPTDAEFIQYSNPTYTTCDNVACTLNELYQIFK